MKDIHNFEFRLIASSPERQAEGVARRRGARLAVSLRPAADTPHPRVSERLQTLAHHERRAFDRAKSFVQGRIVLQSLS
jgi:hypothetical protein